EDGKVAAAELDRGVGFADLGGHHRPQPDRQPSGHALATHSMTAIRSPSWITSPSDTASLVRLPEPSATTGISIFIDSSITSVSPSAMVSPSTATTFHTLATISARISVTLTSGLAATRGPIRRTPDRPQSWPVAPRYGRKRLTTDVS